MKFVSSGPDIPNELLRAQEDNRVVFFCGAGISMGCGLPDFKGLFWRVCACLKCRQTDAERKLVRAGKVDYAFGSLERRLGSSGNVRSAVKECLTFNGESNPTHQDLVSLARYDNGIGELHLVTTNFDRLFESLRGVVKRYEAPALPLAKPGVWNGLVYLHGLIPDDDEAPMDDLVLTNGDFGRAYLLDAWAARFVSEMLRNYVVCFVGYSLSDPVMRYFIDAIDSGRDQVRTYLFLAVDEIKGSDLDKNRALQIVPYDSSSNHSRLHESIHLWADYWVRGFSAKEEIVRFFAPQDPQALKDDCSRGQLLWAILDSTRPALKYFCSLTPSPHIGWLAVILEHAKDNIWVRRGLCIDLWDAREEGYSIVGCLQSWLLRNLACPEVLEYVLQQGGKIGQRFRGLVADGLEREDLDSYTKNVWRLIVEGRLANEPPLNGYAVGTRLSNDLKACKWDYAVRSLLLNVLTPKVKLSGFRAHDGSERTTSIKDFFHLGFDIDSNAIALCKDEIRMLANTRSFETVEICQEALKRGFDELAFLEQSGRLSSVDFVISSIEEHPQNRYLSNEWQFVVEVLRDAWLKVAEREPARAGSVARDWHSYRVSVFKRLALFAAKRSAVVDPSIWSDWLLRENAELLWAPTAKREVCRLLATAGARLSEKECARLSEVIIRGPLFKDAAATDKPDIRQQLIARMVWLRLRKLADSGAALSSVVEGELVRLEKAYDFREEKNQREEFVCYTWSSEDADAEDYVWHERVPTDSLASIVEWLKTKPSTKGSYLEYTDNWEDVCRSAPKLALEALRVLSKGQCTSVRFKEKIRSFIRCCHETSMREYGQSLILKLVEISEGTLFGDAANTIADWCEEVAKEGKLNEQLLVAVAKRVFAGDLDSSSADSMARNGNGIFAVAINHPAGKIAEAAIDQCFPGTIHRGDGIREPYRALFHQICTGKTALFNPAQVILASRLAAFYFADDEWTRENLIPLLDDAHNSRALDIWQGALYIQHPYPPLMHDISGPLLAVTRYRERFAELPRKKFSMLLTFCTLRRMKGYSYGKVSKVFSSFEITDLESSSEMLSDYLKVADANALKAESAKHNRWTRNVLPFLQKVWPNDIEKLSDTIRTNLVQMAVYAGKDFTEVLRVIGYTLAPIQDKSRVLHAVVCEGCCKIYPRETLHMLAKVIDQVRFYEVAQLREVLKQIEDQWPGAINEPDYHSLEILIRDV